VLSLVSRVKICDYISVPVPNNISEDLPHKKSITCWYDKLLSKGCTCKGKSSGQLLTSGQHVDRTRCPHRSTQSQFKVQQPQYGVSSVRILLLWWKTRHHIPPVWNHKQMSVSEGVRILMPVGTVTRPISDVSAPVNAVMLHCTWEEFQYHVRYLLRSSWCTH
jgi:hypothetical protein